MNYKDIDINSLVDMINTELQKGNSLVKIARDNFNVSESSLRKYLNRHKYKRVNNKFSLVEEGKNDFPLMTAKEHSKLFDKDKTEDIPSMTTCPTPSNTDSNTTDEVIVPTDNSIIFPSGAEEKALQLIKNFDRIMNVVNAFEQNNFSNHTEYDDSNNIVIELPCETVKDYRTSIRINNVVWDNFNDFCNKNKIFLKKDLLSQALVDYMKKYDK